MAIFQDWKETQNNFYWMENNDMLLWKKNNFPQTAINV